MFSLIFFLLSTSNIMKINVKKDIEFYDAGYYHSVDHPFKEEELNETQNLKLMNKINLFYEKKDLLDYLHNKNENIHDKLIKCVKFDNDFNYNKYGITITNGGLLDDWKEKLEL